MIRGNLLYIPLIKTLNIKSGMFWFDTQTKTKYILKTFRSEESLLDQKQSCISWKLDYKSAVCFLILFVLMDAILLSLTLQKRTMYKIFFFWLFTHLSNIFAPHIKNLETYFAILICFEFWPLCKVHCKDLQLNYISNTAKRM